MVCVSDSELNAILYPFGSSSLTITLCVCFFNAFSQLYV